MTPYLRKYLLFAILSLACCKINLAASENILRKESILQRLYESMDDRNIGDARAKVITEILKVWHETLEYPESFLYSFDSLPFVGQVHSSDSLIRVYSWNFPNPEGTHQYFGFIQKRPVPGENALYFELKQGSGNLSGAEEIIFTSDNWYGALYYEIIPVNLNNKTYYTLLALDLNDFFTNKKLIDILYFEDNLVKFGAPVFQIGKKIQFRVIFEYSSRAVMSLRYDSNRKMIIHDHLSPFQPRYEGQFHNYGPDFSFDGFILENDRWKQLIDIDISN
jgi:hypothetical protein